MDAPVVGLDVARNRLDIHAHPSATNFAVDRTTEGVEQLCERLRPLMPKLVVLEATGGLEAMVARALTTWGLPAVIVNPARVRAFAHALGQRAKTDRIDATLIVRFAAATNPPVRARADVETQALADLVTRRRQIVGLIASERQRASQAPWCIRDSVRRVIEALEQEQGVIDRSIDAAVDRSLEWRRQETLLTSVPGVGPTIARTLIAELPELGSHHHPQRHPERRNAMATRLTSKTVAQSARSKIPVTSDPAATTCWVASCGSHLERAGGRCPPRMSDYAWWSS